MKAFDRDRLGEVLETLDELRQAGRFPVGPWHGAWGHSLPGSEEERELLREIERAPYFDRPVHHLAVGLRRISALARHWLSPPLTEDQRLLAQGLAFVLDSGLRVLDVQ